MASTAPEQKTSEARLDDPEAARARRREATLMLTMSERIERLNSLCRELNEIKGIARR